MTTLLTGQSLVPGTAAGPVLWADLGLSFMGCVDARDGQVIDLHHPLLGRNVAGKVLAIPSGRGSCSGSLVLFELLMNGHAPAALVFRNPETILTLGVMICAELFGRGIPVLRLSEADFARLGQAAHARVEGGQITLSDTPFPPEESRADLPPLDLAAFTLTPADRGLLAGEKGQAAEIATRLILRTAALEAVDRLVDIDMAHIDGCFYQGPGGVQFAERLRDLGARVSVPTTLNALCVDRRQWRKLGVPEALGLPSDAIAEAYLAMGVRPSYTCAPYLLDPAPAFGQQIAWGESNAVAFANSVLGARTLKYPDYLDILCAIAGRAPYAGCHRAEARLARLHIHVTPPPGADDAFYPLLGYHIGKLAPNEIPVLTGLEGQAITHDDLKAFGAAFATTSAAAMFHILGHTPEAPSLAAATGGTPVPRLEVGAAALAETWAELSGAAVPEVTLVSLGNPHFSASEIARLAALCAGRQKSPDVALIVTCGREEFEKARAAGHVETIRAFGGTFLNDTCWCLVTEPVVSDETGGVITNSGKYAHYGAAALGKPFHFASLAGCVEAAVTGRAETGLPPWLA